MSIQVDTLRTLDGVDPQLINDLYLSKSIPAERLNGSAPKFPHTAIILKNGSQSAIATLSADSKTINLLTKVQIGSIEPRNAEQSVFAKQLMDPKIPLNVGIGRAGTGKTILALAAALELTMGKERVYDKILLCKPLHTVTGRDLGALPGELEDKMDPYMQSYMDQVEIILGTRGAGWVKGMISQGQLQFIPFEYMRGRSFKNSFIIGDELQNLDNHEMETLCSRLSEGSKLVLLGDLGQRDKLNYRKPGSRILLEHCGLNTMLTSPYIQESSLSSVCTLVKNERSDVSDLIYKVFNE